MQKRSIAAIILVAYSAIVIKILVFKINMLKIGHLRFRFLPETGEGNLLPFKSILSYLRDDPLSLIVILNIFGNIALFVPIGFLVPFVYLKMTWQKSLALAVAAGFAIEGMQVALRVGIFDIDDVILNAVGVMIGYWAFTAFVKSSGPRLKPS